MDHDACEFARWDHGGQLFLGMRKKGTFSQRLGVVRQLTPNGAVFECSYKENRLHGFSVKIYNDAIQYYLHKEGKMVARVCFDAELKEKYRTDPKNLLGDFTEKSITAVKKLSNLDKKKFY